MSGRNPLPGEGNGDLAWSTRCPPRTRRRFPPGAHRRREHLSERRDSRHVQEGDRPSFRRHRVVRRTRAVHRHPGQELLVGHDGPTGFRHRDERRTRDPADRRGAVRRRRIVPAPVHGEDRAVPQGRPDDHLREPRSRSGRTALRASSMDRVRRPEDARQRCGGRAVVHRGEPRGTCRTGRTRHTLGKRRGPDPVRPGDSTKRISRQQCCARAARRASGSSSMRTRS